MEFNNDKLVAKKNELPPQDVYTATLELRSVGSSQEIIPSIKWSHILEGDPGERAKNGLLPHSYMAMAQIMDLINGVMRTVSEAVEDSLPEDPDEAAQVLTAMSQKEGKKTKAH